MGEVIIIYGLQGAPAYFALKLKNSTHKALQVILCNIQVLTDQNAVSCTVQEIFQTLWQMVYVANAILIRSETQDVVKKRVETFVLDVIVCFVFGFLILHVLIHTALCSQYDYNAYRVIQNPIP